MKIQELSIGNIIDNNVELVTLTGKDILFLSENDNIHFASPIALTQEKLIELGYKVFPWGFVKEGFPLIAFSITPKENFWIELGNGFKLKLKYVHVLQNFENLL